jgi:hypothetical protein
MMRRLRLTGLFLTLLSLALLLASYGGGGPVSANTLVSSKQVWAARSQPDKVKLTATPIWTLAMDWPRVAYASGKEGNSETIHVWNLVTGATSVVKSRYGFPTYNGAEIAIAGRRLAWVRSEQFGNTELDHWLYTAPLGGSARLLRHVLGIADAFCGDGAGGPQIGGLVGTGRFLAVSTWKFNENGSASSIQQLNLVTPTGLRTIATGPKSIVSESADGGHIAVLPLPTTLSVTREGLCKQTPSTRAAIYSPNGTLLNTIALRPTNPSDHAFSREIALSGKRLVVLTTEQSQSGSAKITLTVYDWATGTLLHTWRLAARWGDDLAVYKQLAAVETPSRLYLVDLNTGKDLLIAPASQTDSPTAIGPRGLVYAVNSRHTSGLIAGPGKLVFVPMTNLLTLVSQ